MIIEANTYEVCEHICLSWFGTPIQTITHKHVENDTATHGRVSATAPTMHEAIALCACGVGQAKNVK